MASAWLAFKADGGGDGRARQLAERQPQSGWDRSRQGAGTPNFSDPNAAFKRWKDTWSAGQSVDHVQKVESAADIVKRFVHEYEAALQR